MECQANTLNDYAVVAKSWLPVKLCSNVINYSTNINLWKKITKNKANNDKNDF